MKILAFDTSLGACTVGVWVAGQVTAQESEVMVQGHAEMLMPMIERVMVAAKLTYDQLDRIAVTVGPGSFTGLRVGISTARGLAMAAHKPALGISTTEGLAAGVTEKAQRSLAVIDSKRGDVFAQLFDATGTATSEIVNILDAELSAFCGADAVVVVGDARARALAVLGAKATASAAPNMCSVDAIARLASLRTPAAQGPSPVYVRAPDVTMNPTGGLLRP